MVEDCKRRSNPKMKGPVFQGPAQEILEVGAEQGLEAQTETQQMGLTIKRCHLWGGGD